MCLEDNVLLHMSAMQEVGNNKFAAHAIIKIGDKLTTVMHHIIKPPPSTQWEFLISHAPTTPITIPNVQNNKQCAMASLPHYQNPVTNYWCLQGSTMRIAHLHLIWFDLICWDTLPGLFMSFLFIRQASNAAKNDWKAEWVSHCSWSIIATQGALMYVNLIIGQQGMPCHPPSSISIMVAAGTALFVFTTAMPSNLLIPLNPMHDI